MKIKNYQKRLEASIFQDVKGKFRITEYELEQVLEDYHKAKMQEKKEYLENIYENAKDEKNSENQ